MAKKTLKDYDFYEMDSDDASKIGPFGKDDYPVFVTCNNREKKFKSMKAAKEFYNCCARCCEGSEAYRYLEIVNQLECGYHYVEDGASSFFM